MQKLLIATSNAGKAREFKSLLAGLPFRLVTLSDEGIDLVVEEPGETYAENATGKAVAYSRASGLLTLADDSGLEIDALGGRPGVRSARYAGTGASFAEKIDRLLGELQDVPAERRTARFRCAIAIAEPGGRVHLVEGTCDGLIAQEPRRVGQRGFGFDPIFYLPDYRQTMAEIPPAVKNRISHRARAAAKARPLLWAIADRAP